MKLSVSKGIKQLNKNEFKTSKWIKSQNKSVGTLHTGTFQKNSNRLKIYFWCWSYWLSLVPFIEEIIRDSSNRFIKTTRTFYIRNINENYTRSKSDLQNKTTQPGA